jgi:nucleotide-binding universal stress UspA family protein
MTGEGEAGGGGPTTRRAVVGYDGSEHAREALSYAARRVTGDGVLIAVYAAEAPPHFRGTPEYESFFDVSSRHGRAVLDELEERVDGVECRAVLMGGPASRVLVQVAADEDADEIVAGTRGFGRFRAALGSVAHALLHEADRPVVVVPLGSTTKPGPS